jgi:DNA-binding GntR family transcriptional regulator
MTRIGTSQLPQSLVEHAVVLLRTLVLEGDLPPGTRLNEVQLAASIGISRGPLREAVRCLVTEGLLVSTPRRGTQVIAPDRVFIVATFDMRIALETMAVRLLARRSAAGDLMLLKQTCAADRADHASGQASPYQLSLRFHGVLLDAAQSPAIAEQARLAQQRIIVSRNLPSAPQSRAAQARGAKHSFADHEALLKALSTGDEQLAAGAMEDHLTRLRDDLLADLFPDS